MKRAAWMAAMTALFVGFLLVAVFPTRTYLAQRDELSAAETRLKVLRQSNAELAARVDELHSDEAIERLAREQYNLVRPGEEAFAILPGPESVPPPSDRPAKPAAPATRDRGFWGDLADTLTFWD